MLAQKNWQLCCLEEHSSRSAAQMVPAGSGQGPPGAGSFPGARSQGWRPTPRSGVEGTSPGHPWGAGDGAPQGLGGALTSAGLAVLLQQVASGAGTQEAALSVFAEEGTWRGGLATLIYI